MNNHTTADEILTDLEGRLDKCKRRGDTTKARCPAHDDTHPSLDIKIGDNGDCVLVKCWAGCETDAVLDALGMTMSDLFATDGARAPTRTRKMRPSTEKKPTLDVMPKSLSILDPSKLPGAPEKLKKGWGAADWDCPDGVDAREALIAAARSHEASEIVHETNEALIEDTPLPSDVPGCVQTWIASLKAADLEGKIRILYLIAESPEWQQLTVELRIAVVWAIKDRMVLSMATVILGKLDDRKMAWRDPPGKVEDTSDPDVVSLTTLLADPLEPTAVVARGLAFSGCLGFIRGPRASGKTTILAAAAARVSQGQPWAGDDTKVGTVLVVTDDDPRSWTLALREFGADTDRILMARARVVSKPGKLAALLAEHRPAWVIIDNLRTWCRSMDLDTDNSSAAADAIDPIAEAIRECGYPVALTILHNEARSKGEGVVVKGVTGSPWSGRMRNSSVFEDAADWIVGCSHVNESTTTTIVCGEKTRRGIPTETLIIDLSTDGYGTPSTGGGPDDPFTVTTPANQLDEKINGYLMANPEGVTQRDVLKSVRGPGTRRETVAAHLKVVGTLGPDNLWRCDTGRKSPAEPSHDLVVPEHEITPPEQVLPEAQTGGGENRGTGGVFPVLPTNGNRGGNTTGNVTHPIGGTVPGTLPGNSPGTHLAVPDLVPLAGAKTDTATTPRGGSSAVNSSNELLTPAPEVHSIRADQRGENSPPASREPNKNKHPDPPSGENSPHTPDRGRPAPLTHDAGTKKWDDLTGTWVPDDDCFTVGPTKVSLSDGLTVTDGDPSVHKPSRWTDDQWSAWENRGMVH